MLFGEKTRYVGRDLEGNKFYEYPSTSEDPRRTKRMIVYRPAERKWDYVSGKAQLPVQWRMWLTHTRYDPPTIEELQVDIARQRRIQQSALQLEAQYEEERQAQQLLPEPQSNSSVQNQEEVRKGTPVDRPKQRPFSEKERMLVPPSAPPTEAQSWSPKTIRRG
ncbi:hypothetical protein CPB86DRAFT_707041 [Serendipita vermifera]|nr:hypothetical protein CPB86DRAFT_707041 [Serendipita vermifera]